MFIPAQVAAAAALLARNSNLAAVLCQFFREDLLAWTSRKGKGSSGGVHLPSDTLKGLVVKNTQQVGFATQCTVLGLSVMSWLFTVTFV